MFIVSLESLAAKAAAEKQKSGSSTGALLLPVDLPSKSGQPGIPILEFIMQQRTPKAVRFGRSAGKQTAPDNEFLVCAALISPLICAPAMFAVIANFRV